MTVVSIIIFALRDLCPQIGETNIRNNILTPNEVNAKRRQGHLNMDLVVMLWALAHKTAKITIREGKDNRSFPSYLHTFVIFGFLVS